MKICTDHDVKYTIVTNKEHNSDIGLVLAHDYAIDKEDIYVTKSKITYEESNDKKGFFSKLFKRRG